jgi:hypothetical protein
MAENKEKKKRTAIAFGIGLAGGIILYKVIFEWLWPMMMG